MNKQVVQVRMGDVTLGEHTKKNREYVTHYVEFDREDFYYEISKTVDMGTLKLIDFPPFHGEMEEKLMEKLDEVADYLSEVDEEKPSEIDIESFIEIKFSDHTFIYKRYYKNLSEGNDHVKKLCEVLDYFFVGMEEPFGIRVKAPVFEYL